MIQLIKNGMSASWNYTKSVAGKVFSLVAKILDIAHALVDGITNQVREPKKIIYLLVLIVVVIDLIVSKGKLGVIKYAGSLVGDIVTAVTTMIIKLGAGNIIGILIVTLLIIIARKK